MCGSAVVLGSIRQPALDRLHAYWCGKRVGDRLPGRASVRPEELVSLLPHLLLVDVVDGGSTLRYRLVGTAVAADLDPTGRILQEALPPGEYRNHLLGLYASVIARKAPLYTRHRYRGDRDRPACDVERVFLPLAADGVSVDMLLIGQIRHVVVAGQIVGWHGTSKFVEDVDHRFLD